MGSLPLLTTLHTGLYLFSLYSPSPFFHPALLALLINLLMLFRIFVSFGLKYTVYRLSRGEIFPLLLYLAWLLAFPRQEPLYTLPVLLSNIGKCYLLLTPPAHL